VNRAGMPAAVGASAACVPHLKGDLADEELVLVAGGVGDAAPQLDGAVAAASRGHRAAAVLLRLCMRCGHHHRCAAHHVDVAVAAHETWHARQGHARLHGLQVADAARGGQAVVQAAAGHAVLPQASQVGGHAGGQGGQAGGAICAGGGAKGWRRDGRLLLQASHRAAGQQATKLPRAAVTSCQA
jgi:Zn ribbon nucleic-acid-binding protein